MCFKMQKPPKVPGPDPQVEAQKFAQFQTNADALAREKAALTSDAVAKAYGFYGTRSLLAGSGTQSFLRPVQN